MSFQIWMQGFWWLGLIPSASRSQKRRRLVPLHGWQSVRPERRRASVWSTSAVWERVEKEDQRQGADHVCRPCWDRRNVRQSSEPNWTGKYSSLQTRIKSRLGVWFETIAMIIKKLPTSGAHSNAPTRETENLQRIQIRNTQI